ncbi:C4-dicarboxylate ABC transporter substrate-binding protein [Planotetraspora thailandica]|uniref:C4-dicarboxylate ABC transporter substrate-binding protein n=1 Tax=Planotetraspora thailandica TaxID=487172 RepID=A0A8J3VFB8_9ACTN|nr:TAXI family TRAP transporter solute-binding subunit [Planotetraspora thailandica]GII57405.1 C4-dicarboxylate ABC transporter substrate-binding protein [Planotetraspora thailandica]
MRGTKALRRLVALAAAGALIAGCGGDRSGTQGGGTRLSIATGNTTGVYYVLGGGLAEQIGKNIPGYQATAEATGASVENIQRVVKGQSDIAFTLADTAADAVAGTGSFGGPHPIRAIARLYDNYTHVLARADVGVKSVADLKGKRVSTGSPNSGTEVIALRLLAAAGLDPDKDVARQALSLPETVQGLKDGTLDALVWSGGLPTAGITDLVTGMGDDVVFVPLDDLLGAMRGAHGPVYVGGAIPKATYGTASDVPAIAVPNLLVVNEKMDPALAENLTRLLFDHKADLERVHSAAKDITRGNAPKTEPVPLHDGAKKYYGVTGG